VSQCHVLHGRYADSLYLWRCDLENRELVKPGSWWWDTIITDPPFGARTHAGARTCARRPKHGVVDYQHWTETSVRDFVGWACSRTRRWVAALTSHDLIPAWEGAFGAAGWYQFAPIPVIIRGMGVRRQGDGPASWGLYLMTARSRSREAMRNPASNGTALWRALPGGYVWTRGSRTAGQGRGKPVAGMMELVRDYSNPGDLVCDPFAGYGSTIAAALMSGRRAVGAEIDPDVARQANESIGKLVREHEQRRA